MTLFDRITPGFPAVSASRGGAMGRLGAVVMAVVIYLGVSVGQEATPSAIEAAELKTALEVARKQLAETEASLAKSEEAKIALQGTVAEANRVAGEVRAQYEELLLRMASLGVDLVKPDPKSLEQRLLAAVRDRDVAERHKQDLARHLAQLSEASVAYLQTTVSPQPEAQAALERELTAASQALSAATLADASTTATARRLDDGRVVSIDSEIGLVVVNVGRQSGVRVGMPLNVSREEKPVGTALVVDVRDSIAGALLQDVVTDQEVKVGDRIKPRPDAL
ncbi:MAG: hypothetical protein JNK37_03155 [Verrucomicrobiales bacterium]|nr:hypothetical protein [Verrucomicrobiales bacterium]